MDWVAEPISAGQGGKRVDHGKVTGSAEPPRRIIIVRPQVEMMNVRMRKVVHASLLGFGFISIWALLLPPANWIYGRLAIHAAFGQMSGSLHPVSVTSIKKPSTVTFSNGVVADVGYFPAAVSSAFHTAAF